MTTWRMPRFSSHAAHCHLHLQASSSTTPRTARAALLSMESAIMRMQTRAINAMGWATASPAVTHISRQALTKLQKIASLLSTQPKKLAPPQERSGFPLIGMVSAALATIHSFLPRAMRIHFLCYRLWSSPSYAFHSKRLACMTLRSSSICDTISLF